MRPWHAKLLPKSAVELLQQAAETRIPHDDVLARVKAIDKAIIRVKRNWPQHFRESGNIHADQDGSGE